MTTAAVETTSNLSELSLLHDNPTLGFSIDSWFEPPLFDPKSPETSQERFNRISDETDYRNNTNCTSWYCYVTLGRYVVKGHDFDNIINNIECDPLKAHSLIWYQYMYHVDRKIDIPKKLEAWATTKSMTYLAKHSAGVLLLDTVKTSWSQLSSELSIPNNWTTVEGKSKSRKLKSKKNNADKSSPESPIQTINEESQMELETPKASLDPGQPNKQTEPDTVSKASSFDKQSVLIPILNVPMNDGTNRLTLRWKTSIDTRTLSSKSPQMNEETYSLISKLFTDEDGHLYQWGTAGVDNFNTISRMTPAEVRSFISPSISIIPEQSMIIIPIQFGFSSPTPATWRNKTSTKATLDRRSVTVSISNSTSTSGNWSWRATFFLKLR